MIFYLNLGIHSLNPIENRDLCQQKQKAPYYFVITWVVLVSEIIVDNTFSSSLGSTWWSMCQPSMALTSILDGLSSSVSSSASPLWCGFPDTPYTTSSPRPGHSRRWAFWSLSLNTQRLDSLWIEQNFITQLHCSIYHTFPSNNISDSLPDLWHWYSMSGFLSIILKVCFKIVFFIAVSFCQIVSKTIILHYYSMLRIWKAWNFSSVFACSSLHPNSPTKWKCF